MSVIPPGGGTGSGTGGSVTVPDATTTAKGVVRYATSVERELAISGANTPGTVATPYEMLQTTLDKLSASGLTLANSALTVNGVGSYARIGPDGDDRIALSLWDDGSNFVSHRETGSTYSNGSTTAVVSSNGFSFVGGSPQENWMIDGMGLSDFAGSNYFGAGGAMYVSNSSGQYGKIGGGIFGGDADGYGLELAYDASGNTQVGLSASSGGYVSLYAYAYLDVSAGTKLNLCGAGSTLGFFNRDGADSGHVIPDAAADITSATDTINAVLLRLRALGLIPTL